jgi:hypothetical protein
LLVEKAQFPQDEVEGTPTNYQYIDSRGSVSVLAMDMEIVTWHLQSRENNNDQQ